MAKAGLQPIFITGPVMITRLCVGGRAHSGVARLWPGNSVQGPRDGSTALWAIRGQDAVKIEPV